LTSSLVTMFSFGATSSTQPPIETGGISTLPISEYSFSPFQTPTQSAVPGAFPSTDPKIPPPVQSDQKIVPDFAPAWAAAYKKAKAKVGLKFCQCTTDVFLVGELVNVAT
jgi:beta-glucosidase